MSVDLEKLKAEVEDLVNQVKNLKAEGRDKDAIGTAVKRMLEAKKLYADNNDGIGVDGKPYEEPLTKAQKKAKAKAEKGPAKPAPQANSANAQKKAAKKEAAKAKKAALKAAAAAGGAAPAAAAVENKAPPPKKAQPPPPSRAAAVSKLQPFQMAINPNVSLQERPVVALTAAVLTNTALDLNLTSDHKIHQTCLGLPGGGAVVGDLAMARYLVRRSSTTALLGGASPEEEALVDAWVDYTQSLSTLAEEQRVKAVNLTLEHSLQGRTYLVGTTLTLADIALFASLGFPSQQSDLAKVLELSTDNAKRWISMMASSPVIREATQLAIGVANNAEAVFDNTPLEPLAEGMNILEGGTPGRVVTRFPPEPSGYLHIGHAKACLLNDYYATRYQGRLIVRFDDTNPSKEKEEFEEAIVEDLGKLGVTPDIITYTSDYFDTIRGYAEYMILQGMAYMDDTPQEQMKTERMEKKESKYRNTQTPQECMKLFKEMCKGTEEGSKWCLRAKIDMQSVNGTMRDPVLYRQNTTPHHRSGTKYKAYPTYDLACPVVDSLEGVTHALRTTEYNDRDEQYQWIQTALNLRRVRIHSFARMNFMYTELSKRKLTWFVENGYVTGWDDPRFPTVRGVVRRGINIQSLRNYMYSQGASRRVVNMEWSKFWAENKKEIDVTAKRFMAIDKEQHVVLTVTNAPEESANAYITTDVHPQKPAMGKRVVRICKQVLLETVDAEGITVGEDIVLVRWGVVKITKVEGGLEGTFVPDGDFKAAKKKLSWIANVANNTPCVLTEFDNLMIKEKLEEGDNFQDHINPNTMASSHAIGDAGLKNLQEHEIFQLERRGYYRVDRPYISEDKPLILFMVPDGKSKAMSGLAGKLAHR